MKTETIVYDKLSQAGEYFDLVAGLYNRGKETDYYQSDLRRGMEYSLNNPFQKVFFINVRNDNRLIAHIALIIDKRLPEGEAFFGFMEFPDNPEVFDSLWHELVNTAREKGITKISGPVNGSIWHAYRVVKNGADFSSFISEPLSGDWYYKFLKTLQPTDEICYYSGVRQHFDTIISLTRASYDRLVNDEAVSIKCIERPDSKTIRSLYELSKRIFNGNWGYVELSENEFRSLYSSGKVTQYVGNIYLVYSGEELTGFCSTLGNSDTTILKTMGILPEWQGKGLGNALVHKIHVDAQQKGTTQMIYALIRDKNQIQNFPRDGARVIREYACLSYDIHELPD